MRRILALSSLAGVCAGALLAGPHSAVGDRPSGRAALLRTLDAGRAHVLADEPAAVCRLLTARARRNALGDFSFEELPAARRPRTCAQAVGRLIDQARADGGLKTLRTDPDYRRFRIVRFTTARATATIGDGTIDLVRTPAGWRADLADFSPFDGSSGE